MRVNKHNHTRYEQARIIGARSLQIAMGAPALLEFTSETVDPVDMASEEYDAGVIPITVRRIN